MLFPLFQLRFGWQVLQFHRQPVEIFRRQGSVGFKYTVSHRLNMEVDLQSLFGLHVTWCAQLCSLAETPQPPNPPVYEGAMVSKDRRHLFANPWWKYLYKDLVRARFNYYVLKSFTPCDYLSKYNLRASIIQRPLLIIKNFVFLVENVKQASPWCLVLPGVQLGNFVVLFQLF